VTLPGFGKVVFSVSKNVTIFLELGTNVTISSHRQSFFWVRLGAILGSKTWPGPGFWVPGFPDFGLEQPFRV